MTEPIAPKTLDTPQTTEWVYKTWRERFILPLLIGVLVFGAIALFPAISASESLIIDAIFITTYLLVAFTTIFRFSYGVRIAVFLLSIYVLGIGELVSLNILGDGLFYFLALVIFATMLHSPRAGIISVASSIVTFIVIGWLINNNYIVVLNSSATPAKIADWFSAGAALIMFGVVIIIGFRQLESEFSAAQSQISSTLTELREERNNLETRVEERTLQLRRINEVERAVSAILNIDEILPMSTRFVQNEFGFYYTAIYLLDPTGQWAELKEAAGEAGRLMMEKKVRFNINGKSQVAQAIRTKTGQIMRDTNQIKIDNPMFPYTRSLVVVPLVVGDTVLGALEMHSSRDNEFLPQDLDAYQNMANGISISIENSRLFQEAQQSIMEMQATQRQYLESSWNSLSLEKSLNYALGDMEFEDSNPLEIPLSLRNQTIGQILAAGETEWSSEQKNLIEAIAAQATLALENARLVENSQLTASQERLTNEIIAKIWSSPNMDGILQTTVRELGRSLEAAEVQIEVSMEGLNDNKQ
ncbi:MAG: GAF domain-containing protein [Anaerolineales bacterium]|nr:GAF domain-containing protein [Anaerolineales bacterium]